ncbi:proton-conducting transporter membrane subunit [Telmatobacter sp. DSM 110680]|uniref:Proton-conducting transporter membrane subunit n=1 Tax=Telmatobacter sp. DSM 110680 TaxID=3036704 RepID=A0AAU7DHV2_9BACT
MPKLNDPVYLLLAPCVLLFGALLQLTIARICSARVKGIVAAATCLPALFSVISLLPRIQSGDAIDINLFSWDGPLVLAFHIDSLSILFAFMGTCLGAIVLVYSIAYMRRDPAVTRFYATMLVFIGGFVALVYCANLFCLYLCWEVIGLCSFSLVGFWYQQPEAVSGARKVLLMTHLAGYGLLIAILVLYHRTGTAMWTDPRIGRNFSTGIFLLMLAALLAKSVQVPLHTWIPDAMAAPTPVSSLLHAACYVTAGVYLAARMHSFATWLPSWNLILVSIASVTMIVGVMYALVQSDLKRMLAFSTVSQIGYMLLGIAIGTPLGIMAGLLHCLNHGFFKGGLFLNAGAVQHAAGTRDMNLLGGLASRMPRTLLCWLIGVGNMAGIPLMSGFVSKWMLYAAAIQAGWAIPAVIAWIASLGTVFMCAKATSAVFLGPPSEAAQDAHEVSPVMQWAMGLMAFGSIVFGVAPQIAYVLFFHPMFSALGMDTTLRVTWLGMFGGVGAFSTTGGLVLAIVSFTLGTAIFAVARISSRPRVTTVAGSAGILLGGPSDVFTGGEPLWEHDRLSAADFSHIFEQNWRSFFRWSNVDKLYAYGFQQLLRVAQTLVRPMAWLEQWVFQGLLVLAAAMILSALWMGRISPVYASIDTTPMPALLIGSICIAAVTLVCAAATTNEEKFLPLQLAVPSFFAVAGCMAQVEWQRFALLEAAALLSIVPVWKAARTRTSRLTYVVVVLLSGLCMESSQLLAKPEQIGWSRALLLTSVCIKFAAIPFLFWLLRLADELPAIVLAFILAVIDIAALGQLALRVEVDPSLLFPAAPWLVIALLTSLVAGTLMLAQRSIKRLLVLSSIEDFGFLLLGVASISKLGLEGVLLSAASHALGKSLLFIAIAAPERDGALARGDTGLATRYPYSAFGFLIGMLTLLGVPPMLGFAGRWKLYETALSIHPGLLGGFVLASMLALIAYVMAFTKLWWGIPSYDDKRITTVDTTERYFPPLIHESMILKAVILLLFVCILGTGVWPSIVVQAFQGGRP